MLMLSGVLKQALDRYPRRRYKLVRRSGYMQLLAGHPAITGMGFPEPSAKVLGTDYWSCEQLGGGHQRPMQILGRMFGLDEPVSEEFYIAEDERCDSLISSIPWKSATVVVAPGSMSPRKMWRHENWETLCAGLLDMGCFVLQIGQHRDEYVRKSYSILGLTTPKQALQVLRRASVVVTVDCFLMHAAHHVGVPSVVLWGPTHPEVYGYPEQHHLLPDNECICQGGCLGPGKSRDYAMPCAAKDGHCIDKISVSTALENVHSLL